MIPLERPNTARGSVFMKTVADRSSQREFAPRKLSLSDMSDLLWATNGINRPEKEGRTAPSALNKQEIEVFVVMEDGAYYYDHKAHVLIQRSERDLRAEVAGRQEAIKTAPLFVVLVANMDKAGAVNQNTMTMVGIDCGIVCQNINLFCAATGLATVPRATMNIEPLKKELGLTESQIPLMNNPVGYKK